jgi:hypothetical protein
VCDVGAGVFGGVDRGYFDFAFAAGADDQGDGRGDGQGGLSAGGQLGISDAGDHVLGAGILVGGLGHRHRGRAHRRGDLRDDPADRVHDLADLVTTSWASSDAS